MADTLDSCLRENLVLKYNYNLCCVILLEIGYKIIYLRMCEGSAEHPRNTRPYSLSIYTSERVWGSRTWQ